MTSREPGRYTLTDCQASKLHPIWDELASGQNLASDKSHSKMIQMLYIAVLILTNSSPVAGDVEDSPGLSTVKPGPRMCNIRHHATKANSTHAFSLETKRIKGWFRLQVYRGQHHTSKGQTIEAAGLCSKLFQLE